MDLFKWQEAPIAGTQALSAFTSVLLARVLTLDCCLFIYFLNISLFQSTSGLSGFKESAVNRPVLWKIHLLEHSVVPLPLPKAFTIELLIIIDQTLELNGFNANLKTRQPMNNDNLFTAVGFPSYTIFSALNYAGIITSFHAIILYMPGKNLYVLDCD